MSQCLLGFVRLFEIIPLFVGAPVGELITTSGNRVLLSQTQPSPFGTRLSSMENQFVIVCGRFTTNAAGQRVFDVSRVFPLFRQR